MIPFKKFHTWQSMAGESQFSKFHMRVARRWILEKIEKYSHAHIHSPARTSLFVSYILRNSFGSLGNLIRNICTRILPWDPLTTLHASEIDIFILTSSKDLSLLPYSIYFAIKSSLNPIINLQIVAPKDLESKINVLLEDLPFDYQILSDETLISNYLEPENQNISGTPKMEILKFLCALHSSSGNALVVDGDTLLVKGRNWVSDEVTVISVAQEYLKRHIEFSKAMIRDFNQTGLGFITHHQLIRKDYLKSLLIEVGGIDQLVHRFERTYNEFNLHANHAYPSEWQLYGDWVSTRYVKKVRYCNFSNVGMPREVFISSNVNPLEDLSSLDRLREKLTSIKGLGSISLHAYKSSN